MLECVIAASLALAGCASTSDKISAFKQVGRGR